MQADGKVRFALPAWLVGGVLLVNLFVCAFAAQSLLVSREQHHRQAEVTTQNLAEVLSAYTEGLIARVDQALLALSLEYQRELGSGGADVQAMDDHIARLRSQLGHFDSVRAADAQGVVRYGVAPGPTISIADREYFIRLRDDAGAGLVISRPVLGRITGKWVLIFARRVNHPDGRFAGAVYANMLLEDFAKFLDGIETGKGGVISLRDEEMGLIARSPELKGVGVDVGSKGVSPELRELRRQGRTLGTYDTPVGTDQVPRTVSFRKVGERPLFVIVGASVETYLAPWRVQVRRSVVLVVLFLVLSAVFTWLIAQRWRRHAAAVRALAEQETQFRIVANFTCDWEYWLGPGGELRYMSPSAEAHTGYSAAAFEADPGLLARIVHPDERDRVEAHFRAAAVQGPGALDFRLVRRDGQVRWISLVWQPVGDQEGRPAGRRFSGRDVTDRVEAELSLREAAEAARSAERFTQATLDAMADQVCVLDAEGVIVSINQAWRRFAEANGGASVDVLFGNSYLEVCRRATGPGAEEAGPFADGLSQVLAGERSTFQLEYPCHSPAEQRWFIARVTRFGDGPQVRVVVAHQDISELKRAEAARGRSEAQLVRVLEGSSDGFGDFDAATGLVKVTPRYCEIQGLPAGTREISIEALLGRVLPEDLHQIQDDMAAIAGAEKDAHDWEYRIRRPDGTVRWIRSRGRVVGRDPHGAPVHVSGAISDLTERKLMERQLASALAAHQRLVESAPAGILVYQATSGRCVVANRAVQKMVGGTEAQLLAQDFRAIPSWQASGLVRAAEAALATGAEQRITLKLNTTFGRTLWVDAVLTTFEREDGLHLMVLLNDITARQQAGEDLRASEARYRALADSVTDMVFALDPQLRYTFWNRESERSTGIAARDAIGRTLYELFPGSEGGEAERIYREVLGTGSVRSFHTSISLAGRLRHYDIDCYPSADGVTVFSRDTTERREWQERVSQMERLAAVGTLVAGIGHEINNPLTAVAFNVGFAREKARRLAGASVGPEAWSDPATLEDLAAGLDDAAAGAQRIKEIVAALRHIAPGRTAATSASDLPRSVELALVVAKHALAATAGLTVDVPALPPVRLSESELVPLLANLLVNAGQATGARANRVRISAALGPPGVVTVKVEDTGVGMSPEAQARAFEPFFTTREVGRGTGLGLSVCRGIVLNAGGQIELRSVAGRGTTVTVTLPVAARD